MYNKKYVGILAALLGLGMLFAFTMFWGCSSNSSNPTVIRGDLNDPSFQAIRTSMESTIDSAVVNAFTPLDNRWGFPLDSSEWHDLDSLSILGPLNPDDSVDYQYNDDGWHVIYVTHLSAAGSEVFYDSLGFFVGDNPWKVFDFRVDDVKYRGSYDLETEEDEVVITTQFTSRIDIEDVNTTTATSTGTIQVENESVWTESGSDFVQTLDFDVTFDGIECDRPTTDDWETYEVTGGEVDISLTYILTEDDVETVEEDWTIEVTVDGDVAHIDAIKGNVHWIYDYNL
jgi:hypothetical protein